MFWKKGNKEREGETYKDPIKVKVLFKVINT